MDFALEQLGGGTRLTPELVERYRADGDWVGAPLGSWLDVAAEQDGGALAALTVDGSTGEVTAQITYAELHDSADRLAAGLSRLGIGVGDTVQVMLTNRLEFSIVAFAVARLGAVFSGIPVTYGEREAAFMMGRARSKALVISSRYRRRDLVAFARAVRLETPGLEHIVVLDGDAPDEAGWHDFDDLLRSEPVDLPVVDPLALVHLGFTSGTTGEPKAVMNNHETIGHVLRGWGTHIGSDVFFPGFVNLVISPVGHGTGFYWGALFTTYARGTAAYVDGWDPSVAVKAISGLGATVMIGSPTFLLDLMRQEGATAENLPSLRMVCIPGAPIPRPLVAVAREQLGCLICPAWGMTEWGIGVSGSPRLPRDLVEATDGVPVGKCEVRIVDELDEPCETGLDGNLQIRGPGLFLGYYDRPDFTAEAFVGDWFRTGDRASVDDEGWVTLRGRTKDIVIRGGENIPVVDVENLIYEHPDVQEAAVIGVPDPRLGERACAVLTLKPGAELDLASLSEFLLSRGISKRFLPEQLEVVESMPKTASGKIRKLDLRARLGDDVDAPA